MNIGDSDIAALIMVGCNEEGLKSQPLNFGEDGDYSAYIVDKTAEIGSHYKKVAEFSDWLKIYDDDGLCCKFSGGKINVFRAGLRGCIIQIAE